MTYSRETLVAKLRDHGVRYLAPSDAVATEEISSNRELIIALIESDDPRLRMALIPLLLRNPQWHDDVEDIVTTLSDDLALDLKTYYMVAAYLQRFWKTNLGFYIDTTTSLPDLYSTEMELPSTEERFGKLGLYYLADAWQKRSIYPFDRMASITKTFDLFIEQLAIERVTPEYAPAS